MANKHKITAEWKGNMAFDANIEGHIIRMDAPVDSGGDNSGASPKKLMLAALSGCTGMDVVSILKKMRVDIKSCHIEVSGNVTDEHPKQYETMHITYEFHGKNLPMEKLKKAVNMSEERYCGVGAFYRKVIDITSEIRIIETD